jgi:hypothetical protein
VVGDLDNYKVLAEWALTDCENYPLAFDELHHRIFIECRNTGTVRVLDSQTGKEVASMLVTVSATSDDMIYNAREGRLYVLARAFDKAHPSERGPGLIDVFQEQDPDHYKKIGSFDSGWAAQTGLFVPEWGKLFTDAVHMPGGAPGEMLVFKTE